jgi:hypothetical protein
LPSEHGRDPVQLVLVGNRREPHDLPILLRQHVAHQIILVQPVHDQHDGAGKLVVEAAVEGVVIPFVGRPALRLRQGFLGLERIVDDDDSAPRPVSTPPTEVASRQPCCVVSNSPTACRWAERRVASRTPARTSRS